MSDFKWTAAHASAFTDHFVIMSGKSDTGAEKYCRVAGLFFAWAEANKLALTSDTVNAWMKYLAVQCQNSNKTRATRLSGLRSVCKWLVARGYLKVDPCEGTSTPKFSPKAAQKFSAAELTALFSEAEVKNVTNLRDRCILILFYATGIRREEMSRINLDRITLASQVGRVQIVGKGKKQRTISFEGPIVQLLHQWAIARYQYAAKNEQALFIALHGTKCGTRMSVKGLHDVIKRVARRVGLGGDVFLHKLRSTFATDLYDAQTPINEIALLMGHESIETTNGYIAISERHLQKSRIKTSHWSKLGVNP